MIQFSLELKPWSEHFTNANEAMNSHEQYNRWIMVSGDCFERLISFFILLVLFVEAGGEDERVGWSGGVL